MLNNVNGYKTKEEWFLGKGSFGSVYKAEKDGVLYAIKVFQSELLKTEYKSRLDREIQAIKKISHPNVVKVHDFGTYTENEFEYFYIVMDLVDGKPLTEFVGTVDEVTCIRLVSSILDTLDAVHKDDVIHRDLKPQNIMVRQNNVPVILDFGLAKLIDYSSITQTGERVGTFSYMSPEQVTDSKHIDYRSDYFAIGVICYQLLTGVLPYDATNLPALIDQIKNQYPKNPSELNGSISNQTENVILKLLEKDPYKRFQTVADIKQAFQAKPLARKTKLDFAIKYYIRLLHTEKTVFEAALKANMVQRVIFPANFFKFYHPTVKILRSSDISFTTDPATNRLTYSAFSKTAGVQELPYSSGDPVRYIQAKDFQSISQTQTYVQKVIEYQISNGVTELVAPFFYARSTSDEWFGINLKLLKEAIDYRDQHYKDIPIWGGICMSIEGWADEEEKTRILNRYVKVVPDGFFVYGDPVGNHSNLVQLFHYADLLQKLQSFGLVPVVACRVNGLGLILLSLGISGISSGIGSLDSFKEAILSDTTEGYAADPRYYIPELLSMVPLEKRVTSKLIAIASSSVGAALKCPCVHCIGVESGKISQHNMKLHFLFRRNQEIEELINQPPDHRLSFIETRLQQAISYRNTLKRENIKLGDFSYLDTWMTLVEQFKKRST